MAKTSSDSGIAYDSGRNDTVFSVPFKNKGYQNSGNKKDQDAVIKLNNKERNKRTGSNPPVFSRLNKTKEQRLQPIAGSRINKDLAQSIKDNTSENIVVQKDSAPLPGNEGFLFNAS